MKNVRAAHSRYTTELDEKKQQRTIQDNVASEKRKLIIELKDLEKKKIRMRQEVDAETHNLNAQIFEIKKKLAINNFSKKFIF